MAGLSLGGETWWGVNAWQGQVWKEAWKRQVGRRELRNSKASPREGEETAENHLPHTMCHSPYWASAGRVAFYYFVFLKPRKCIRGHFLVVFGIRSGPSQGFYRIRRGIRACVGRYVSQNGWFSGPCLATLLPRLIEIARACNHSSWFKFSSLQYLLENYKLRNMVRFRAILCLGVPIQCQRLQFSRRPWCQRFYRDFMAPLPCENTSAAWQLFFTARTWAKPHRLDSSVTLLLRVVQSKTQWHSNVLKLLQKSSQALNTFFQLLQIKRLQLKLTNTLQNSYQIQSQHQAPRTCVKQHPKTLQTTKTNENPSPSSSMHKLVPFGSKLVPTWCL